MFKRIRWFTTGAVTGVGAGVVAVRKVKRTVDALRPDHVVSRAVSTAKSTTSEARDRLSDGRAEARRVEAELRARWMPGHAAPEPNVIDVPSQVVTPRSRSVGRTAEQAPRRRA
jgi:hypothetical protein